MATLLIVGPKSYDPDFEEFASVFDELIETSFQVVGTCNIVGRAPYRAACTTGKIMSHDGHKYGSSLYLHSYTS
jgi:hypothetical protein